MIKIVTDSTADLPPELAARLGITVVPAYVCFGDKVYRGRVDISDDEFYRRLLNDPIHPSTMPPTPQEFAAAYQKLSGEADGIISIHISGKLSATVNSALRGKELLDTDFPIEVVDSRTVTMGTGLLAIAAADLAISGKNLPLVAEEIKTIIPGIQILGYLDTLKYLASGGRIGWAKALLGSMLKVKPMLTMTDGELEPCGRVRSRSQGTDRLIDFVKSAGDIRDLSIIYSTTPDDAQTLAEHISGIFPAERIRLSRLGPVLGVHAGPGILFVALRTR